MTRPRFHLAFPVHDLAATRTFYGEVLGCPEGRSSERWVDFDLFEHQIVAHLVDGEDTFARGSNAVDGHGVPVPHFGLVLEWEDWESLRDRLVAAEIAFVIEPYVRFEGEVGEQATMFVRDPSGNALEFKAFRDESLIFASDAPAS